MRTSHKAKDAAAEKQSSVCDTFTGHGKAHQPPLVALRFARGGRTLTASRRRVGVAERGVTRAAE
jgi:hypothetical protein